MVKKSQDTVFDDMADDSDPREARSNERVAEKRRSTSEARGLTHEELINKFRHEMYNNVIPTTPDIPGYHLCWLSTTNQYDSIAHRESLGYERVKPEDLPGMDHITISQGPFAGCIGLNELVLFKLPVDLWHAYMAIAHDQRPYEQEEKVREIVRYTQETVSDGGGGVYLGDGMQEIMNARRRTPTFTE